jgi:hypothetical protein
MLGTLKRENDLSSSINSLSTRLITESLSASLFCVSYCYFSSCWYNFSSSSSSSNPAEPLELWLFALLVSDSVISSELSSDWEEPL